MTVAKRSIRVPVTIEQYDRIHSNADAVGLGLASYLRQVGLGYAPSSVIDHEKIDALHKALADLARLGNLMKRLLWDKEAMDLYPKARLQRTVPDTIQEIRRNQTALLEVIERLRG